MHTCTVAATLTMAPFRRPATGRERSGMRTLFPLTYLLSTPHSIPAAGLRLRGLFIPFAVSLPLASFAFELGRLYSCDIAGWSSCLRGLLGQHTLPLRHVATCTFCLLQLFSWFSSSLFSSWTYSPLSLIL